MRVITGTARGTKLISPTGRDVVRPTSSRVKESIFNIIQMEIAGSKVLDLFSGSGQLGIEALSRGAEFCVFLDNNLDNQKIIKENLKKTKLFKQSKVIYGDALSFLLNCKDEFDFIFLDPPYKSDILEKVLDNISDIMNENSKIICETDKKYDFNCKLNVLKDYRYGNTKLTVLVKEKHNER